MPGEDPLIWFNVNQKNGYQGSIDPTPFFNGFYAEDAQKVITKLQLTLSLLQQLFTALKT
jgi:hypothetical protein